MTRRTPITTRLVVDEWIAKNLTSNAEVKAVSECVDRHQTEVRRIFAQAVRSGKVPRIYVSTCHLGTRHVIFAVTDLGKKTTTIGPPHVFPASIHAAIPKN